MALEFAMPLRIPSCLEDLSNEDILLIAWEPEFLEQASPLERLLLQRLGEQGLALEASRQDCQRLVDLAWNNCSRGTSRD